MTSPSKPADHAAHAARYAAMRRDLAAGVVDLHDFAARHALTRLQLARWTARPRHAAVIDQLARFADRRAALLLAAGRADALRALHQIAIDPDPSRRDLARKACLDLLKLGSLASPLRRAAASPPPIPKSSPAKSSTI